jgi:hypothetical protein
VIELTLVVAVYGQPLMLAHQLAAIRGYGPTINQHLNLIVVDDCGDPPADLGDIAKHVKSAQLFRVTEDIPWNQPGARNLGMHHASGWCLMLDPDMVIDGPTMVRMMHAASKLERRQVLKFALRHVDSGKLDMASPNTWLLHRDDFFEVGGYVEHYAGAKGWSDCTLQDVLRSTYKVRLRPDLQAHFHSTASVPDAMVTCLDRSTSTNKKKRLKDVAKAKAMGGWVRWAKARVNAPRLNFPWVQVYPPPASSGQDPSAGTATGSTT